MPLYEFSCEGCGNAVDVCLSIADRNVEQVCHKCKEPLKRIISCKIERVEPTYIDEMKLMLPRKEQETVHDRHSFRKALDRSGLITV